MIEFFGTDLNGKIEKREKFSEHCWVMAVNPTDDECEDISALSGVPEDMLKAALDEEERARTELNEGCNMFIVDCPIIEDGACGDVYTTLPLAVIYNYKCVVTVCLKENKILNDFASGSERIYTDKPLHFILTFLLGNAKRFLYCLKQIDRKNHRIQSELDRTMRNEQIIQLLDLQNSLVYFSTSLASNDRVHEKLSRAEGVAESDDYRELYDDVCIENKQAIETCNIYKNILNVTMDAYGSVISNNANYKMERLTIITILLAVPTMIAGFWGMNMPVPGQSGVAFYQTAWFWLVIVGAVALTAVIAVLMLRGNISERRRKKPKKKDRKERE